MQSPASILNVLWAQGFAVELTPAGSLLVSPASTLHDSQRQLLRDHKAAIVEFIQAEQRQADAATTHLLAAAMRACDFHGDGPAAREQMRRECISTPAHLRQDLLDHLDQAYPTANEGRGGGINRLPSEIPQPAGTLAEAMSVKP